MTDPLVHVLVVNWNGMAHLRECFESLCASSYPNARFVLIDNGSTDGSAAYVRDTFGTDPRVEIIEAGSNLGWSGGNNLGIDRALEAGAQYVFLLNNDTVTDPDAIAELVRTAEANPKIGALAAKMLLYDHPRLLNSLGLECSTIAAAWDRGIGRVDGPRWNIPSPTIGACGGAAFFRAEALKAAGPLPREFEIYLDDLDLCLRVWDAGYEVWTCPAARVRHKFSATMGTGARARRKYYLNTRNRFYLIARNFPARHLPTVLGACALGETRAIARAILDGEPWRALAHTRAWVAALAYLPKARKARAKRTAGLGTFWNLVNRQQAFFPGMDAPERGWYQTRQWQGLDVRPISTRAELDHPGGPLRVTLACCYPQLGPACVVILAEGAVVARLETSGTLERTLDCPGGQVVFEAERLFEAEATGERADYGGWLAVESGQ